MNCSIIILNFNGRSLLSRCLPSVITAAQHVGEGCKVVLADNRSTDDSVEYVRNNFPTVEIIITGKNDYLFSLNDVVKNRTEDIVIILNNDMIVDRNFIPPLLGHFSRADIFAVTCRIYNQVGDNEFSKKPSSLCFLRVKNGWYQEVYKEAPEHPCYVQLASGGASAFRREVFVSLGGFDTLFRPGYCEDTDLSLRAWRFGWKVIYEPRSFVYHFGSVSMNRLLGPKIKMIVQRNRILLITKAFGTPAFLAKFLLLYPKRMLQHFFSSNKLLGKAMLHALPRMPKALSRRIRTNRLGRPYLSEADILKCCNESAVSESINIK